MYGKLVPGGSMKSSHIKIMAVTLALAIAATVAVSQTVKRVQMHGDGMFSGHMLHFFADYLSLTDAQQTQVKEILTREKPTIEPLMQQMAQSHHQLREMVMSGGFDEAKVRALASQQSGAAIELLVERTRIESELFQVLTPEQKTKL